MKKGLNFLIIICLVFFIGFALFPGKLDYTDKAKVLQGLSLATVYKQAVNKYWKEYDHLPSSEDWNNYEGKTDAEFRKSLVKSIKVGEDGAGMITIYYTNSLDQTAPDDINGTKIVLKPSIDNNRIIWTCKGTMPIQYLPVPCR